MFKLESYIAPFIMGYIDKYVQLKQEDFQISLWGGDAVLNKLDLRLEAIENALLLPITLKSGHIHELRIHVPWTNFGAESVVITINTIEFVVKLRDGSGSRDDGQSSDRNSKGRSAPPSQGNQRKKLRQDEANEDLPPGYIQSYINKIFNNVNIVVNNLILKFVEDDIVLSVNIKSAELYSVNSDWKRAFVELTQPELVLRRVLDCHDLTMCLDKRNASGKIEIYQDPVMYRCSLTCRLYTAFDSLHSKAPSITRLNIMCDKLDLSLTDTQLPLFLRLIELCLAIYYNAFELTSSDKETAQKGTTVGGLQTDLNALQGQADPSAQGWTSWAWSYVPALLTTEDYDDDVDSDVTQGASGVRRSRQPTLFSMGMYCARASISFKISEMTKTSGHDISSKVAFRPSLLWHADGIGFEMLMRGDEFLSVIFGISNTRMFFEGTAVCGVIDTENSFKDTCFFRCGKNVDQKSLNYLTNSLFDANSAENQGNRPLEFILTRDKLSEVYTESHVINKYGAFFLDYCLTIEKTEDTGKGERSASSVLGEEQDPSLRETAALRVVLAPAYLSVNSSMVQRLHKLIFCSTQHDYQPYIQSNTTDGAPSGGTAPNPELVQMLEQFVATQAFHITLLRPHICLNSNDLPPYDVTKHNVVALRKSKKLKEDPKPATGESLPALLLQAERIDLQTTRCMYPRHVVRIASAVTSSNLLHHAHAHTHVKVFCLEVGLTCVGEKGRLCGMQRLLQPWSFAVYHRKLLLPSYWKNPMQPRVECIYEIPQLAINVTRPQLCLLSYIVSSWQLPAHRHERLLASSLLEDVFDNSAAGKRPPVLELVLANCELKTCTAEAASSYSASLTSLQALLIQAEGEKALMTPLLYGPVDNTQLCDVSLWRNLESSLNNESNIDVLMCTVQIPNDCEMPAAPGVVLLETQGVVASLDPKLYDWLCYEPRVQTPPAEDSPDQTTESARIDAALAEAAYPLKGTGSNSESNVTNPTGSLTRTVTQSLTQSQSAAPVSAKREKQGAEAEGGEAEGSDELQDWGSFCAKWYPVMQMMHVQVDVRSWCLFLPSAPIILEEPTMNIALNMRTVHLAASLPATCLLCLPRLQLLSAGQKRVIPLQDLPVKSMDQSVAAEKLPWSISFSEAAMLTLTPAGVYHVVQPCDVKCTLAVTCTYDPPASQHVAALSACVHCDAQAPIALSFSKHQVGLLIDVSTRLYETAIAFSRDQASVNGLSVKHEPTTKPVPAEDPVHVRHTQEGPSNVAPSQGSPRSSGEQMPIEIKGILLAIPTETLESDSMVSRDSPVDPASGRPIGVKLSLWLQATLPKSVLKLYCTGDRQALGDILLMVSGEDISASLDMQAVYCKLTSKLGAFNITHFIRHSVGWVPGDYQGVLLTSTEAITRNTHVISHKHGRQRNLSSIHERQRLDNALKEVNQGHAFGTLIFTRALKKNVKKKLKMVGKCEAFASNQDQDDSRYLNEVCLYIQPFDVVLNCPIMASALQVLHPRTVVSNVSTSSVESPTQTTNAVPNISADMLPLLYINTDTVRIFIPKTESYTPSSVLSTTSIKDSGISTGDVLNSSTNLQPQDSEPIKQNPQTTTRNLSGVGKASSDDDLFILELGGVSLNPHADNPLPRLVVAPEVYRHALESGQTKVPGAQLEDRQYQLDADSWSLSSGRWSELQRYKPSHVQDESQNPALEWNNRTAKGAVDVVELVPVASSFDLRVTFAPAILQRNGLSDTQEVVLVCGHSIELNATSDLDFFVSLEHLKLAHQVVNTNFYAALHTLGGEQADVIRPVTEQTENSIATDTPEIIQLNRSVPTSPPSVHTVDQGETGTASVAQQWTPFNVLLTAGKISISAFKHVNGIQEDSVIESAPATQKKKGDLDAPLVDGKQKTRRLKEDVGKWKSEESSTLDSCLPEKGVLTLRKVVPILYVFFSQPHSFLSIEPKAQKIELSCFDLVLKGAKPGYGIMFDVGKCIPEPSDYSIHWIETKPGHPNSKTGIPPSLYTFRATDFLHKPASLMMHVERPLKLNLSLSKLDQIQTTMSDVLKVFSYEHNSKPQGVQHSPPADTNRKPVETGSTPPETEDQLAVLSRTLTRFGSIDLKTVQLVVVMETIACREQPLLQLSIQEVSVALSITANNKHNFPDEAQLKLHVYYWILQTSMFSKPRPLIGPFVCAIDCAAVWGRHSGPPTLPRLSVNFDLGVVPINIGQSHVACLQMLTSHLQEYFGKSEDSNDQITAKSKESPVSWSRRSVCAPLSTTSSEDDLRSGLLSYVTVETSMDELPVTGEILFSNDFSRGLAAVTWCYSESRVITHLSATPLPLNLPPHVMNSRIADSLEVPCILQYWDSLHTQYYSYAEFSVSEHGSLSQTLAAVSVNSRGQLVASTVWRVIIQRPSDPAFDVKPREDGREAFTGPLLSPLSLAAALKVDSCFSRHLVPMVEGRLRADCVRVNLSNHNASLGGKTPDVLTPFNLDDKVQGVENQVLSLTIEDASFSCRHFEGKERSVETKLQGTIGADILEYRNLCMLPLLDSFNLDLDVKTSQARKGPAVVSANLWFDPLTVRVCPSIVHTLNTTLLCWQQINSTTEAPTVFGEHYVICNDTEETLLISQTSISVPSRDQAVVIGSRKCMPYSWLSHKHSQILRVCLESFGDVWSPEFSIDDVQTIVRTIQNKSGDQATLVIRVTPLTKVQKMVVISGCLLVSNQVCQELDIKVLTTRQDRSDKITPMSSNSTLPSFIVEPKQIKALKIRLGSQKVLWSQELPLTCSKPEQAKLMKVPSLDGVTPIHVWCQIYQQKVEGAIQTQIVFTPLFVLRSQLPVPLLVVMETARLHTHCQQELGGRGAEMQVLTLSGDITHSFTFQLSGNMKPSKPALQLNAGMIDQVQRRPLVDFATLTKPDSSQKQLPWPYNQLNASPEHTKANSGSRTSGLSASHQEVSLASPAPAATDVVGNPNIDLQVTLSQWRPGAKTLLVEVAPYLLLSNEVDLDLWVIADGEKHWKLPAHQRWAPPVFQGAFRLGLVVDNELQLSEECSLFSDESEAFSLPHLQARLGLHDNTRVSIPISLHRSLQQICYLSLHSTQNNNMRIVTIREAYSMTSSLTHDVTVMACATPLSLNKVPPEFSANIHYQTVLKRKEQENGKSSLLFWNVLKANSTAEKNAKKGDLFQPSSEFKEKDLVHYVMLRQTPAMSDTDDMLTSSAMADPVLWSCPMRIKLGESGGSRQNIALPMSRSHNTGWSESSLLAVSAVSQRSTVYMQVCADEKPQLRIQNQTPFALHFGQYFVDEIQENIYIYEEVELIEKLPMVLPYADVCYTCPALNAQYTETVEADTELKLHFAVCLQTTQKCVTRKKSTTAATTPCTHTEHKLNWSQAVPLTVPSGGSTCCIALPGVSDVKIRCQRGAHTTHLQLQPISRAEISAKEIRCRFKGTEKIRVITTAPTAIQSETGTLPSVSSPDIEPRQESLSNETPVSKPQEDTVNELPSIVPPATVTPALEWKVNVVLKQISFVIFQEEIKIDTATNTHKNLYRECLRLTLDNCVGLLYPQASFLRDLTSLVCESAYEVSVLVGDMQLDNQIQKHGKYDFPVLVHHQEGYKMVAIEKDFLQLLLADKVEVLDKNGFLGVSVTLAANDKCLLVENFVAKCAPAQFFVEDTFVFHLLKVIDKLVPVSMSSRSTCESVDDTPLSVKTALAQYSRPIRLKHLLIEPISMDLSVHASLKLFIASDHSPLKFSKFEKQELFLTSALLTKTVAMHFAFGAIFRAGWVLGSLELLGNPTGLVRSVGTGVADLVLLPYSGLTRGPGAFLAGVSQGMASFLRNVTAGTLVSVSCLASSVSRSMDWLSLDGEHVNFTHKAYLTCTLVSVSSLASSVSRNMDRLSLDGEHMARQAAGRQRTPSGLTEGLANGLTGFGLSLLGAVAGLADQPLQTITRPSAGGAPVTPSQRASGLVSGVGKGLLGVVTKPLGGAAELVSQTSLGLLQGTGLARFPRVRTEACVLESAALRNSAVKITQKFVDIRLCGNVVQCISGQQFHHDGKTTCPVDFDVILTEQCLVVMETETSFAQQVFSLADVECVESKNQPQLLFITVTDASRQRATEEKSHADDRVQAFVRNVSGQSPQVKDNNSERGLQKGSVNKFNVAFHYKIHVTSEKNRRQFLELFSLYRERNSDHGFST